MTGAWLAIIRRIFCRYSAPFMHPRLEALVVGMNEPQLQAVTAPCGNSLVIAGAGSGKTRVLTHRFAWLVLAERISPFSVMAVTFTNKAAAEMRERIAGLLDQDAHNLCIGTFHSIAFRIIRRHRAEAGLPSGFEILDSDDQKRIVKRIMGEMNISHKVYKPSEVARHINEAKDYGRRADQSQHLSGSSSKVIFERIYAAYETYCIEKGFIDFGEMLLRAYELWQNHSEVLDQYRRRFQHILVDEFQDTNTIQYEWIRALAGDSGCVMAVGDDDQSIYSWRGAQVENIRAFVSDFSQVEAIRLEQNYRSTANILDAANAVIENNTDRMGKMLWTSDEPGDRLRVHVANSDREEAAFVIRRIAKALRRTDVQADDCAILYRSNAQSRLFEQELTREQIPYRMHGGFRFFERREVRDAMAYLQLMHNPNADAAFERIVNTPPRGIGENTIVAIREYSRNNSMSMTRSAHALLADKALSKRAAGAVTRFLELMSTLCSEYLGEPLDAMADAVIATTKLREYHGRDPDEKGLARTENLDELVSAARHFQEDPPPRLLNEEEEDSSLLEEFVAQASLDTGDAAASARPSVQLMTLHAAKGLEFPVVFLTGMEEDLFPHGKAIKRPGGLEEERRLCYVGLTRARQELYLTLAEHRYIHGDEVFNDSSRFVREIPERLIDRKFLRYGSLDDSLDYDP